MSDSKDKKQAVCQGSCGIAYAECVVRLQGVKCPFEVEKKKK